MSQRRMQGAIQSTHGSGTSPSLSIRSHRLSSRSSALSEDSPRRFECSRQSMSVFQVRFTCSLLPIRSPTTLCRCQTDECDVVGTRKLVEAHEGKCAEVETLKKKIKILENEVKTVKSELRAPNDHATPQSSSSPKLDGNGEGGKKNSKKHLVAKKNLKIPAKSSSQGSTEVSTSKGVLGLSEVLRRRSWRVQSESRRERDEALPLCRMISFQSKYRM